MQARLIVTDGKASKREIIFRTPAVIGRSREADLTITHPLISRHHCELYEVDGLLMVRDLGSLNGTAVDRRRVLEAPLKPGDLFSIGPLTFRVEYEYAGSLDDLPEPRLDPKQEMPSKPGQADAPEKKAADEAEPSPPPTHPAKADEGPPPEFDAPSPPEKSAAHDEIDTEQEEENTEHIDGPESDEITFEEPEPPAKPEAPAEPDREETLNFQPESDQSSTTSEPDEESNEPIAAESVPDVEEPAPPPPKPDDPPKPGKPPKSGQPAKKKRGWSFWPFGGKKGEQAEPKSDEPKSDSDAESTKDAPDESQDAALNDFLKGLQ